MCEQYTREFDFSADIANNSKACRKVWLLLFGKHSPFIQLKYSCHYKAMLLSYLFMNKCMFDCSFRTHMMGALRILMSQTIMGVSPAGDSSSREKVEEEAVGSRAGAEGLSSIILLLFP